MFVGAEIREDVLGFDTEAAVALHDLPTGASRRRLLLRVTIAAAAALSVGPAFAASICSTLGFNTLASQKTNKLYLYFPAADDASYLEFGDRVPTSPAHVFDVAELPSYLVQGSDPTSDLITSVTDVVTDIFCEFNVEVLKTRTLPLAPARRSTVAVGTDAGIEPGGTVVRHYGLSQGTDPHDQVMEDYSRAWAGSYQRLFGGAGGELEGSNSTLGRWANSIGGTAAHEAGHNYGLDHFDGTITGATEDSYEHHLMADGPLYTGEQRAAKRHFSDHEYSLLAANVGLAVQTVQMWTLVNPNKESAAALQIEFLSTRKSVTLANVYTGNLSPWGRPGDPTNVGTTMLNGVQYFRQQLTWNTAQTWSGGSPGTVDGGVSLQVAAGFVSVDPHVPGSMIVKAVKLFDVAQNELALRPRLPGMDAGSFDAIDGTFAVNAYNFDSQPIVVEQATMMLLPRLVSIDSMGRLPDRLVDAFSNRVTPWKARSLIEKRTIVRRGAASRIAIARLRDGRRDVRVISADDCARSDSAIAGISDVQRCRPGISVGLFPATVTLLTLSTVDPNARHWDREREAYATGPVRSLVSYQLVGQRPDLNHNGVDDYIDIVTGKARDRNLDGVVDEVQRR